MANRIAVGKAVAVGALLYLLYVTVKCPCTPQLFKCHLSNIYGAIAIYLAIVWYFNGFRMKSYR